MYPWQKSAVLDILKFSLRDKRNLSAVATEYFKSHKKLGKRDRQIILEKSYLIARNALFNESVWEDILESKVQVESVGLDSAYSQEFLEFVHVGSKESQLSSLNELKMAFIRIDSTNVESAKQWLSTSEFKSDFEFVSDFTVKVQGKGLRQLNREKEILNFKFEFQDFGSQTIIDEASKLILSKIDSVLDYCAGNGGKTLQLVDRLNPSFCHSCDVHGWKLENLKYRANFHQIESRIKTFILPDDEIDLEEQYDFVLLDVPCSGTGTWGREPIQRAFWSMDKQKELEALQNEILQNGATKVRSGAYMCYATCSILDTENLNQVKEFLAKNSDFKLLGSQVIEPVNGHDGFFWALLQRD